MCRDRSRGGRPYCKPGVYRAVIPRAQRTRHGPCVSWLGSGWSGRSTGNRLAYQSVWLAARDRESWRVHDGCLLPIAVRVTRSLPAQSGLILTATRVTVLIVSPADNPLLITVSGALRERDLWLIMVSLSLVRVT